VTATVPSAARVVDGTRHLPTFLGDRGAARFACLHLPDGPARAVVVFCSSIGAEWKYNYRREVLLARMLAHGGFAAVRFHYLGTGHSDDGVADFGSMVADARLAEGWAHTVAGTSVSLFFGAKFGALVAAAAGRPSAAPVVAWGAPATGADYFRELFRLERAGRLGSGLDTGSDASPELADSPRLRLARGEPADVLGYTVPAELYASAQHVTFDDALGPPPRTVRLIEVSVERAAQRALRRRVDRLAARGFRVSSGRIAEDRSWWFHDSDWRPDEERESVRSLLVDTVQWCGTALSGLSGVSG